MNDSTITAGIVGGAGYTGGETIRLLLNHPKVTLTWAHSRSQDGKRISNVHKDLVGDTPLSFTANISDTWPDVLFLCLPHGESQHFIEKYNIPLTTRIIDLGNDFRLDGHCEQRSFVYGLPELHREKIKTATSIANPGCFATAIQLGLLPLSTKHLLGDIYTVGITGSTGAGQQLQATTHFSWRNNNISAYKTLTHQHNAEIIATLKTGSPNTKLNFVPWRGDFTRGIFISSMLQCTLPLEEIFELYQQFYSIHPFVFLSDSMIDIKQVVNTNKCVIYIEKKEDQLVIHSAIDNLLKGAAGQAVQNMNIGFGFEETEGLNLKASVY